MEKSVAKIFAAVKLFYDILVIDEQKYSLKFFSLRCPQALKVTF